MNKTGQHVDLLHLERLAETNPKQFMHMYEHSYPLTRDANLKRELYYLKAKALMTLSELEQAKGILMELLSHALDKENQVMISKCNLALSICYKNGPEASREKPCLDIALDSAHKAADDRMVIECLAQLGAYHIGQANYVKAIKYYARAEKLSQDNPDSTLGVKIMIAVSTTYYHAQQYDKAQQHLVRALDMSQGLDNHDQQLIIMNNLSTLYMLQGRMDQAESILNRGLSVAEQNDQHLSRLRIIFNLGVLLMRQEKYRDALNRFHECEEFAASFGYQDPTFMLELNSNMAGCYRYKNKNDLALNHLQKAISLAHTIGDFSLSLEMDINRANLLIVMGKPDEAGVILRHAIRYFTKQEAYDVVALAQRNLAEYYLAKNNTGKAIDILKELETTYQKQMNKLLQAKTDDYDRQLHNILQRYSHHESPARKIASEHPSLIAEEFVGRSATHAKALELATNAARHPDASVMITGESGTGKEVLARLIHSQSARRNEPFIAVKIPAIHPELVESELFGHVKGSFSSAITDHKGFLEQATRGTLFLDEICDLPASIQTKLLRAMQTRKITPMGAKKELRIDCRVICATNRNIYDLMKRNLFRLDLFQLLNTIEIEIAPLRNRSEDIEALTQYYVQRFAMETNRRLPVIEESFMEKFRLYPFPGNARELRNLVERLFILNSTDVWDERALLLLPLEGMPGSKRINTLTHLNQRSEKEEIIHALEMADGKQKDAARILGTSESTLTRKIAKYGLEIYTRKGR